MSADCLASRVTVRDASVSVQLEEEQGSMIRMATECTLSQSIFSGDVDGGSTVLLSWNRAADRQLCYVSRDGGGSAQFELCTDILDRRGRFINFGEMCLAVRLTSLSRTSNVVTPVPI